MNLLIITLDSVRLDHFRGPVISAWRREGTFLSQCITACPETPQSHASLFSGCYPPNHGVRSHADTMFPWAPHLFEILERDGFNTSSATNLKDVPSRRLGDRDNLIAALAELRRWKPGTKNAMFFHVWTTHYPYLTPSLSIRTLAAEVCSSLLRVPEAREVVLAGYRAAIEAAELGVLLPLRRALEEQGVWEETVVVLWSDHGEAFGDGGEPFHGYTVHDSVIRVPVLFLGPGVAKDHQIDAQLRTIDIAPTLCDLFGSKTLSEQSFFRPIDGRSFSRALSGREEVSDRIAYFECNGGTKLTPFGVPFGVELGEIDQHFGYSYGCRLPETKYVRTLREMRVYDLVDNPAENTPECTHRTWRVQQLEDALGTVGLGSASVSSTEGSASSEALMALGYLSLAKEGAQASRSNLLEASDYLCPSYQVAFRSADETYVVAARATRVVEGAVLPAEVLFILETVTDRSTVRSVIDGIEQRFFTQDESFLDVFPQYRWSRAALEALLTELTEAGVLAAVEGRRVLTTTCQLDAEAAVIRRSDRAWAYDLQPLDAMFLERLLRLRDFELAYRETENHARAQLRDGVFSHLLLLSRTRLVLRRRHQDVDPRAAKRLTELEPALARLLSAKERSPQRR